MWWLLEPVCRKNTVVVFSVLLSSLNACCVSTVTASRDSFVTHMLSYGDYILMRKADNEQICKMSSGIKAGVGIGREVNNFIICHGACGCRCEGA